MKNLSDDTLSDAIAYVLNRYRQHISSSQILDEMHGVLFQAIKHEIYVAEQKENKK